jgi:hypothetical protein
VTGTSLAKSPRPCQCLCQPHAIEPCSPLTELMPEHIMPELVFLETKWAALVSYDVRAPRKPGWFEVIVGKSLLTLERDAESQDAVFRKYFAFVQAMTRDPNGLCSKYSNRKAISSTSTSPFSPMVGKPSASSSSMGRDLRGKTPFGRTATSINEPLEAVGEKGLGPLTHNSPLDPDSLCHLGSRLPLGQHEDGASP